MSWKDLKPLGRATVGTKCGYALRNGGSGKKNRSLEIVLAADVLRRSDWKDGSWLKLQSDGKMIRLVIVTGASKTARKLRISQSGRGNWSIPATGDIADLFGAEAKDMTPLNLVEATSEHVCMEFVEGGEA